MKEIKNSEQTRSEVDRIKTKSRRWLVKGQTSHHSQSDATTKVRDKNTANKDGKLAKEMNETNRPMRRTQLLTIKTRSNTDRSKRGRAAISAANSVANKTARAHTSRSRSTVVIAAESGLRISTWEEVMARCGWGKKMRKRGKQKIKEDRKESRMKEKKDGLRRQRERKKEMWRKSFKQSLWTDDEVDGGEWRKWGEDRGEMTSIKAEHRVFHQSDNYDERDDHQNQRRETRSDQPQ